MKRVLPLILGVLLLAAPGFAQAKADASKTLTAAGKVSAVTADSVTVKGKDAEWTFSVDKATTVTAKGASHKMASLGADKKPAAVTEFVAVGDAGQPLFADGLLPNAPPRRRRSNRRTAPPRAPTPAAAPTASRTPPPPHP
jgi:hypothetical protein